MNIGHVELPGSYRPSKENSERKRSADPAATFEVTIGLRGPALPDVNSLPKKAMTYDESRTASGQIPRIRKELKRYSSHTV